MYLRAYIAPRYSHGWSGAPMFNTREVPMANGYVNKNGDWAQAQHKFMLPFKHLSPEQLAAVMKMVYVCRGKLHNFLFVNPANYVADEEIFAVGDGVTDTFRLSKLYVADIASFQMEVDALYMPNEDGSASEVTPVITVDGSPTTAFTSDPYRATVVFDAPPGVGEVLRWSGNFSFWVAFALDYMPFNFDQPQGTYGSVELTQQPVPPPEPI